MKALHHLILAVLLAGCGADAELADAYGNFESTEVTVASEIAGRLVRFDVAEGSQLEPGVPVAQVDTTQLGLKRAELEARRQAVRSRYPGIAAQEAVLKTQRSVAERELTRFEGLVADGAATEKTLDDVRGQLQVLDAQIDAVRSANPTVFAELGVLHTQLAALEDQIRRASITNPVRGVVLTTFVQESELTSPGRPLYRIAPLDTLELRAFISGDQLAAFRLGQQVDVTFDAGAGELETLPGRVSWIASQAEFTPKLIQTREERVSLVYAIKVRVSNADGRLKIGMPGEVRLPGVSP
ncbi:MAG: HlyD family efflux transporter periplasmic adaptor subunit [Rhodothermales bacterium]|nr:HlyD family efflux transporter periplasmic adaptor subunit [Rhodothermales bacterium]